MGASLRTQRWRNRGSTTFLHERGTEDYRTHELMLPRAAQWSTAQRICHQQRELGPHPTEGVSRSLDPLLWACCVASRTCRRLLSRRVRFVSLFSHRCGKLHSAPNVVLGSRRRWSSQAGSPSLDCKIIWSGLACRQRRYRPVVARPG
jgi:hypothetical protein